MLQEGTPREVDKSDRDARRRHGGVLTGGTSKARKKKRRGAVSSPCPMCGGNSHVVITNRVEGVVIRTRRCLRRAAHTFKTKEVHISS